MDYTVLTNAQQQQMLSQRIGALEADHFGHELNIAGLMTLPDDDPGKADAIAQAKDAQATIEAAHGVAVAALADLSTQAATSAGCDIDPAQVAASADKDG